jgi:hypothetical protein
MAMAAMVGQAPPSMSRAASIEDEHGDREGRKARRWHEAGDKIRRMSLYSEAWQYRRQRMTLGAPGWPCCCSDKIEKRERLTVVEHLGQIYVIHAQSDAAMLHGTKRRH